MDTRQTKVFIEPMILSRTSNSVLEQSLLYIFPFASVDVHNSLNNLLGALSVHLHNGKQILHFHWIGSSQDCLDYERFDLET